MAEPADLNVDELRRRARRRLVGAVVLALGVAVVVPMLLETEQKPLGEDVSVKIPPVDSGKFVNRLNDAAANGNAAQTDEPAKGSATPSAASDTTPGRTQKYDTRVPDAATGTSAPAPATSPAAASTAAATAQESAAAEHAADPGPATQPASAKSASSESARPESGKPVAASAPAASDATRTTNAASEVAKTAHMTSAAAPREGYAVQLAAFADDRGANSLAGRLKKAGYAAYTEPLKTSKGTLWRVRVGPYPSHEAAVAARDKLKTEGQSGIVAAIK